MSHIKSHLQSLQTDPQKVLNKINKVDKTGFILDMFIGDSRHLYVAMFYYKIIRYCLIITNRFLKKTLESLSWTCIDKKKMPLTLF